MIDKEFRMTLIADVSKDSGLIFYTFDPIYQRESSFKEEMQRGIDAYRNNRFANPTILLPGGRPEPE